MSGLGILQGAAVFIVCSASLPRGPAWVERYKIGQEGGRTQKGDRGAGGEGVGVVSPHRLLVAHSSIVGGHPQSSWCEMWTGHGGVHLRSQHQPCGPAEPEWQL